VGWKKKDKEDLEENGDRKKLLGVAGKKKTLCGG